MKDSPWARVPVRAWLVFAARLLVLMLVAWGITRTLSQAQADLSATGVSVADLDPWPLIVAGITYLMGMLLWSLFWHRILKLMGENPHTWDSVRAFLLSQPGKYVPGKFMVVAIRTAIICRGKVNATVAAASCFVETLSMMALGAVLGAVLLPFVVAADWRMVAFAVVTAVLVGLPTVPGILRQLVKWTRLHRLHPEIDRTLVGLTLRRLAPNWPIVLVGWLAMGASLWATLLSMPDHLDKPVLLSHLPLLTTCIALSTVVGFLSGLPGGLVAREWVVMALVRPEFGVTAALLSAVVHRGVTIAAELVCSLILLLVGPRRPDHASRSESDVS